MCTVQCRGPTLTLTLTLYLKNQVFPNSAVHAAAGSRGDLPLHMVQNAETRVVFGQPKWAHIPSLLIELQYLPAAARILLL